MGAVEFARRDVVEAVVVVPRQPVGAIRIGPDPVLKRLLDPLQLVAGRLGVDDIEYATFAIDVPEHIEDLRNPAVQRIGEQISGMAAARSPL